METEEATVATEVNIKKIYWLKEGPNSFSHCHRNDLVLPRSVGAAYAGILFLKKGVVFIRTASHAHVKNNGRSIDNQTIYSPTQNLTLQVGNLTLKIVCDGSKLGVEAKEANG